MIINILKKPRLLKLSFGHFLRVTNLSKFFFIKMDGFKLRFFPSAHSLTLWVHTKKERNNDDVLFFKKVIREGDEVVDIGANIGLLTLTASTLLGKKGKVLAIEAHPQTFKFLSANVELNQRHNIELQNYALGDAEGTLRFESRSRMDDQNRVATALQSKFEVIEVAQRRLDTFDLPARIDLLKIDVEGYELYVFKGGHEALKRTECIYFESWEKHFNNFGYTTSDLLKLFHTYQFKVFKFDLVSNQLTLLNESYLSEKCENLLAVKNVEAFLAKSGFSLYN